MERGLDITGVDLSRPMLDKLKEKAPDARAVLADLTQYAPEERCDYIFIPAGSLGLFTELDTCMAVLKKDPLLSGHRRAVCVFRGHRLGQKRGGRRLPGGGPGYGSGRF